MEPTSKFSLNRKFTKGSLGRLTLRWKANSNGSPTMKWSKSDGAGYPHYNWCTTKIIGYPEYDEEMTDDR